jgi:hypothetical protein
MTTREKLKIAWKHRRTLWKYRELLQHRRELAAAAVAVGVFVGAVVGRRRNGSNIAGARDAEARAMDRS